MRLGLPGHNSKKTCFGVLEVQQRMKLWLRLPRLRLISQNWKIRNRRRQMSEQESGKEVPLTMISGEKGKLLESDLVESGNQEKIDQDGDEPSTCLMTSTFDKDMVIPNTRTEALKNHRSWSGPLMPGVKLGHSLSSERGLMSERCENEAPALTQRTNCEMRRPPSFSGPLMLPSRASVNSLSAPMKPSGGFRDSLEDRSKANLVQIKGRFSVTSENVDLSKDIPLCTAPEGSTQGSPLNKSASVGDWAFPN